MPTSESEQSRLPARLIGYTCLTVPVIAMLWVPLYAADEPRLVGVPFFYWYQFLWVVLTPVLMAAAYRLLRAESNAGPANGLPS